MTREVQEIKDNLDWDKKYNISFQFSLEQDGLVHLLLSYDISNLTVSKDEGKRMIEQDGLVHLLLSYDINNLTVSKDEDKRMKVCGEMTKVGKDTIFNMDKLYFFTNLTVETDE